MVTSGSLAVLDQIIPFFDRRSETRLLFRHCRSPAARILCTTPWRTGNRKSSTGHTPCGDARSDRYFAAYSPEPAAAARSGPDTAGQTPTHAEPRLRWPSRWSGAVSLVVAGPGFEPG